MKVLHLLLVATTLLFAYSCSLEMDLEPVVPADSSSAFYASIEGTDDGTKVYTDESLHVYWDNGDDLSIFNHGTDNSRFTCESHNGGNSATFLPYSDADGVRGNTLPFAYAVFPYAEDMSINSDGDVSLNLPAVQSVYYTDSFGETANTMMAVSEDNLLLFKNVCGYLIFQFTGKNNVLTSLTLKSNNGEPLAGPALVSMQPNGAPVVEMQNGATDEILVEFERPFTLYDDDILTIWVVVPPVIMSDGFTVTVTDQYGGTFTKSTDNELIISRNKISRMEPAEVVITYDNLQTAADVLYKSIGQPWQLYQKPDDWGILCNLFCNDIEGADAILPNNGYNWFNVCSIYEKNSLYRNTDIRYYAPMNLISVASEIIGLVDPATASEEVNEGLAQIRALRAWAYLLLAQNYQFTYLESQNLPCVPLITENTEDPDALPRATVAEVYDQILSDLDFAVAKLENFKRTSKAQIDKNVARGLRARVHLLMGNWAAAYSDAAAAAEGYVPASIEEVSSPSFYDINEHNWIWGYDMEDGLPGSISHTALYSTTSGWLRSFSGESYSAAVQVYCFINKLLWDKIPESDVRKGWWVDENLSSPLLNGLAWPGCDDVAHAIINDEKTVFLPFTNVKFGCKYIGTTDNDEDMPLMRVEEMILIQAEAKAHSDEDAAKTILENFVKTYRNPSYGKSLRPVLDEIWFQRRVELWGEGFGVTDNMRLGKPVVRFHDENSNVPVAYRINLMANDPVLLLQFPSYVLSNNPNIENNPEVATPVAGQNPELRDGVTD